MFFPMHRTYFLERPVSGADCTNHISCSLFHSTVSSQGRFGDIAVVDDEPFSSTIIKSVTRRRIDIVVMKEE